MQNSSFHVSEFGVGTVDTRVSGGQEKNGGISFRGRSKWRPCHPADDGRPQFFIRGLGKTLKNESLFCCHQWSIFAFI